MDKATRVKRGYATIKIRNVAAIPAVLVEFGADPANALHRSGLDPDLFSNPENVMPFVALGRLVSECVGQTGREDFGLRVGAMTKPSSLGLTGLVSINSALVRDALKVIVDTLKISGTGRKTFLDVAGDEAAFGYAVVVPGIESVNQIVDGAVAIMFNVMRRLRGPSWRPNRVTLIRDPPRDPTPFTKFFGAPIDYAEPSGRLVFDAATLDEPVCDSNLDHAEILAPLLEEAAAGAPDDFLSAVRAVVTTQIGAGALSRDRLCKALGLNARTLTRRLANYGVSYATLADEARFDASQGLLLKGRTIAEVAEILGFADQSAFTRAFKAWSGATPARWRAQRRVADE